MMTRLTLIVSEKIQLIHECDNKKNSNTNEEDGDIPTETPPKIIEAIEMVR
jgi:hypothetical protein